MITFNRIMTETYQKESLKPQQATGGLALNVKQKIAIVGLSILADAKLQLGSEIVDMKKGGKVLVRESDLHNNIISTKAMSYDSLKEEFLVVEGNYVLGYEPPSDKARTKK